MRRLDDVARQLNPLLALVITALLYLNFACALNLIDWRDLPDTPASVAASGHGSGAHPSGTPD